MLLIITLLFLYNSGAEGSDICRRNAFEFESDSHSSSEGWLLNFFGCMGTLAVLHVTAVAKC